MIPIVSTADDGYIHHFAAMLHSASLYHPDASYYLLDAGLSDVNRSRLSFFSDEYEIDLTVIPCRSILEDRLPNYRMMSSYARLLIPELLGDDIERCLYIDADTTVTGSLDELSGLDMDDCPIAAAIDTGSPDVIRQENELHGIVFDEDYFNAGVMVMDLRLWRIEDIADKATRYAQQYPERMLYWEQSSLNVLLYRRSRQIDPVWNFFRLNDVKKLSGPPRIIHYTTLPKPTEWPETPFADLYKFHRDQTPWPFAKLPLTQKRWLKETRTVLGATLGIEKYRQRREYEKLLDYIRTEISAPALARAKALSRAKPPKPASAAAAQGPASCT